MANIKKKQWFYRVKREFDISIMFHKSSKRVIKSMRILYNLNMNKKTTDEMISQNKTKSKKTSKDNSTFSMADLLQSFQNGNSNDVFSDQLDKHQERLRDSVKLEDGYGNSMLGIGRDNKTNSQDSWDLFTDSNNWSLWLALYTDSWIFRKAIDKTAQDVANLGIRFVEDDDKIVKVQSHLRDLTFDLTQLLMWGSLFGGSIAIMLLDNIALTDLEKPLLEDDKRLKKSKKMKLFIMDRWSGVRPYTTDLVTETTSPDFLKPRFYDITIGGDSYKVHYSWILRYDNRIAPNLLRNGQLNGWGYAEGVHLIVEIKRDERLKNSISSLIDKSLIEVIKMPGMKGAYMGLDLGNAQQMNQRLGQVNWGRNYNSITFLDSEDDYSQNEFGGLSGLADLMDRNMENIAAALDMTGVLFGDMSGGFSPDNFALVRYDTTIRNKAESYFKPVLTKLIRVLASMEDIPMDANLDFEFETMIQINADPLEKAQQYTTLYSNMIGDGYMTPEQAGEEMMKLSEELGIGFSITKDSIASIQNEEDEIDNESDEFYNIKEDEEEENDIDPKEPKEPKESEKPTPPKNSKEPKEVEEPKKPNEPKKTKKTKDSKLRKLKISNLFNK